MNPERADLGAWVARTLVVIAVLAIVLALWTLRDLLLLVFASLLVAVVLDAAAELGRRRAGLSRGVALALAVVAAAAGAAVGIWLFGSEVRGQLQGLIESLPASWRALQDRAEGLLPRGLGDAWLSDAMPGGSTVLSTARSIALSLGSGITDLVVALVGGIYLASNPLVYRTGLLKLLPAPRRPLAEEALGDCGRALRMWLLGQGVSMLLVSVLTIAGLWWIGVPSPVALGLLAGLLDFVPVVGPLVALVPALLLALAQGPETALWTIALYLAVQQLEGNVIQPIVQQRAVELPPALLVFAIIGAGVLFGGIGVVLAAPLTVVAFVLVKRLYVRDALDTPTPVPGEAGAGR